MQDSQCYSLTAHDGASVDVFNRAVSELRDYELSAMPTLKRALELDPDFYMAHVLRGYMLMVLQSSHTIEAARAEHDRAKALVADVSVRERMHLGALRCSIEGDWLQATARWASILAHFPRDILALRLHHFISFWMGRSEALMRQPAAVLPAWDEDAPGCGNVYGMLCFGLEEMGQYARAETYGRRAVELNSDDHKRVGIPMVEALLAFETGDMDRAAEKIALYKPILIDIGASHAQRDVISLFEVEAVRRGGKSETLRHLQQQRSFLAKLAEFDPPTSQRPS